MRNRFIIFSLISSIIAIFFVFILQYGFAMSPCKLCLWQRVPYYIIIILSCFYLFRNRDIIFFLILLSFFINSLLALYHSLIEYQIIENIFSCSSVIQADNIASLKELLVDKISTPCDKVQFKFMLSLSGWNFVFSIVCLICGLFYKRK